MLPMSGNCSFRYNFADLVAQVKVGDEFDVKGDYTFVVFSESLMLMAAATTWECNTCSCLATLEGRTFSMTMSKYGMVWMPGKYFFLMAPKNEGSVIRFDMELDDKCCFTVGESRRCDTLSDEGILARQVLDAYLEWDSLCCYEGIAPLRSKVLQLLKWNADSPVVGDNRQGRRDAFGYNLLVTPGGYQWSWQSSFTAHQHIPRMVMMCIPNNRLIIRVANCSEFYNPENENPYAALDALFDEKTDPGVDPLFDEYPYQYIPHDDYRSCTVVYVFYNVDDFDSRAMNRLQEAWQDDRHFAIFCGGSDEIDRLLENYPSLKDHYPEANRVALAEPLVDEVIHDVFRQPQLLGCQYTPEAVDKLCRIIVEDERRGDLCSAYYYASRVYPKDNYIDEVVIDADDIEEP